MTSDNKQSAPPSTFSPDAGTVRLHRVLRCPPDKIYRAFLEPDALCRWLPPFGFIGSMLEADIREGGFYRMSFTNFGANESHSFTTRYKKLIPNEYLHYTSEFEIPSLPGVCDVTVVLKPVLCGTELTIVQAGIPAAIPVEFCYLGWQESLLQLANLVEPNIPAGQ